MPEPTGHRNLEWEKHEAVARDHLPRVARYLTTYDDGSQGETQHVLYWGGAVVQSVEASAWSGPLPADPTPEESDAAVLLLQQGAATAATDAAQIRQTILNDLQSAVGVPFSQLSNPQLRAVVAALAWQAGALNRDTTLRPPTDWLR